MALSDNEIEDVSFLPSPGQGATGKRAVYEPKGPQRCRQIICTKNKAVFIVAVLVIFILIISLIASLARPGKKACTHKSRHDSSKYITTTPLIATDGTPFPWTNVRLPKSVIPLAYDILMHPNLTTFKFQGTVKINIKAVENTNFIVFHKKNLDIQNYDLAVVSSREKIGIKKSLFSSGSQQVYLDLQKSLIAGHQYELKLAFSGDLSQSLTGFYRSSYKTSKGEVRFLATTHFEPTDARAAFPCFDEPEMKANFTMIMVRERQMTALFNMPRVTTEEYANHLLMDRFEESVKMSTYLVAFVVCDYETKSKITSKNTKVSVYAPAEQINQADFALDIAHKVLEYYEDFFNVPYPLPKQDLIGIPDFAAGAMENWGLITYRMSAFLYDEKVSSTSNKQWVAVVVAHELAHQWFGNLVTMKWWNDLWLNEGFAKFMEYKGTNYTHPEWKMHDQFLIDTIQAALHQDSLSNSHPISVEVSHPEQINEIFDSISYSKGASILSMLEYFLGADVMKNGLTLYLNKFKYKNAQTDDLWASLTHQATLEGKKNVNVKLVMDTWTRQMGYPVVKIVRSDDKLEITQKRFLLSPSVIGEVEFQSPYGYKWHIPLTIQSYSEYTNNPKPVIQWMTSTQKTVPIEPSAKWFKANINQRCFYRVNYDDQNWDALSTQLRNDRGLFTAADKASLLDDAFALARAGELEITRALHLSVYLITELECIPMMVGLDNLNYIGTLLQDKPSYKYFQDYVAQIIKYWVENIGWDESGDHLQKMLRTVILSEAIRLNDPESVKKAKELFNNWMNNGVSVSADLKNVVYRAGIQYGGQKEWDFCWSKYHNTSVPSEKRKLLSALATSTDALTLTRFLHMAMDPNMIRTQDTVSVIAHISANPAGRVLTWRFVKQNWGVFKERYGHGSFEMSGLIRRTTSAFNTQYDFDEVKEFFQKHDIGSGTRAAAQAIESIHMNLNFLNNNQKQIENWLSKQTKNSI